MNSVKLLRTRRRAAVIGSAGVLTLCGLVASVLATPASAKSSRATASAAVTVNFAGKSRGSIPAYYLGLSFESEKAVNTGLLVTKGNLARMLENLGPGVLRLGGNSVDYSYPGASRAAVAGLSALVRATGWDVTYSVNLGQFNLSAITTDVANVSGALGSHLASIACGNEPDDYATHGLRQSSYTESDYIAQAGACMQAVHAGAPKMPISGPDTYHLNWLPPYAAAEKGKISQLTEHYYPLHGCHGGLDAAVARAELLSPATTAAEAKVVSTAAISARVAGVPLRIDETNSANCGGVKGASDSYASALWAVDYLLTAAESGASGMNFHGSLSTSCDGYTPLCEVTTREYAAQPVYYGLLFTHLLGTGRLIPVRVSSAANVVAYAIGSGTGRVRVLVENLSGAAVAVSLHAGHASGTATAIYLTGPSLAATSGVRIQGAAVKSDGTFSLGKATRPTCRSGTCPLWMPRDSAIIVTLPRGR